MATSLRFALLLLSLASLSSASKHSFRFAKVYGDHMVLQRSPYNATLWGYSNLPAQKISGVLMGSGFTFKISTLSSVSTVNSSKFVWKVFFPQRPAGGPYKILAEDGFSQISLSDVYFGDVFVCAGQSNMQFTVQLGFNASKELAASKNFPLVRIFTTQSEEGDFGPVEDVISVALPWSLPSKDTLSSGDGTWGWFSATCWFFGRDIFTNLQASGEIVPLGLIQTDYTASEIEAWSTQESLDSCGSDPNPPPNAPAGPNSHPSSLFNGLTFPLLNATIKGMVWYQGETNVLDPMNYTCLFPRMINDYRDYWALSSGTNSQFPFIFVQLAGYCLCDSGPFQYNCDNENTTSVVAPERWAQTAGTPPFRINLFSSSLLSHIRYGYVPNPSLPFVHMATAYDLADPTSPECDIHPRAKQEVGRRLAVVASCAIYGLHSNQTYSCSGPSPHKAVVNNISKPGSSTQVWDIDISFTQGDSGSYNLTWLGHNSKAWTFDIIFPNDVILFSKIESIPEPNVVSTSIKAHKSLGKPIAIRYAWRDRPCAPYFHPSGRNCQLYYGPNADLPLYPFVFNL